MFRWSCLSAFLCKIWSWNQWAQNIPEIWIKPKLPCSELSPNTFNVFRKDRPDSTGGGLLICIPDVFPFCLWEFLIPHLEYSVTRAKIGYTYIWLVPALLQTKMFLLIRNIHPLATWCFTANFGWFWYGPDFNV